MTWAHQPDGLKNRLTLDMILMPKKFKTWYLCYNKNPVLTFIPNNTAPVGTITKAFQGLLLLSKKLTKNTGVNSLLKSSLKQWFDKLKGLLTDSLIITVGTHIHLGC